MNQNDLSLFRPCNQACKKIPVGTCAGGIVWIVEEEGFCLTAYIFRNIFDSRQKAIFFQQRNIMWPAAGHEDVCAVPRITGIGDQHNITGIDHRHHKIMYTLL